MSRKQLTMHFWSRLDGAFKKLQQGSKDKKQKYWLYYNESGIYSSLAYDCWCTRHMDSSDIYPKHGQWLAASSKQAALASNYTMFMLHADSDNRDE